VLIYQKNVASGTGWEERKIACTAVTTVFHYNFFLQNIV